jgi:hypothetical protein
MRVRIKRSISLAAMGIAHLLADTLPASVVLPIVVLA